MLHLATAVLEGAGQTPEKPVRGEIGDVFLLTDRKPYPAWPSWTLRAPGHQMLVRCTARHGPRPSR
jgi:hypothetical protein